MTTYIETSDGGRMDIMDIMDHVEAQDAEIGRLRNQLDFYETECDHLRAELVDVRQCLADAMMWVPLVTQNRLRAQWAAREKQ